MQGQGEDVCEDRSGCGHPGERSEGFSGDVFGGKKDYIHISDVGGRLSATADSPFSVLVWVYPHPDCAHPQCIVCCASRGDDDWHIRLVPPNTIEARARGLWCQARATIFYLPGRALGAVEAWIGPQADAKGHRKTLRSAKTA